MIRVPTAVGAPRPASPARPPSPRRSPGQPYMLDERRVDTFASVLVHELSQPLAAVLLNLDVAVHAAGASLGGGHSSLLVEILDDIRRDALRVADVLDGLRAIFLGGPPVLRTVDVNAVVTGAAAMATPHVLSHGAQLQLDLARDAPWVMGQEALLGQVVLNLLRNSTEALTDVPEANRRIVVTTARHGDDVEVVVSDAGPGIPPAIRARLFREAVTTKVQGNGIGLRVSSRIVSVHAGVLAIRRTSHAGTAMVITLPAIGAASRAPTGRCRPT